jgi:hypothetical protein
MRYMKAIIIGIFAAMAMNIAGPAMAAYPDLPPKYQGEWCAQGGGPDLYQRCGTETGGKRVIVTENTLTVKQAGAPDKVMRRIQAAPKLTHMYSGANPVVYDKWWWVRYQLPQPERARYGNKMIERYTFRFKLTNDGKLWIQGDDEMNEQWERIDQTNRGIDQLYKN